MNTLSNLIYHVPPFAQGQAVELAYALDPAPGGVCIFRRTLDRSDGSICYEVALGAPEDLCIFVDEQGEPQNWYSEPDLRWREATDSDLEGGW
jgi:hypothetical protein